MIRPVRAVIAAALLVMRSERMSASDQTRWGTARTIGDLGELTAEYLEDRLTSQPAYQPFCGPDAGTRELIPVLAAANRAGFMTYQSEPGRAQWGENAGVFGYADDAMKDTLARAFRDSGLVFQAWRSGERPPRGRRPIFLTTTGDILRWYTMCHPDAVEALLTCWQISIEDPEVGRVDRLWPLLRRVVDEHPAVNC